MALASDGVAAARRTLQDYDIERVDDVQLLKYFNGARRAFAIARPSAYDTTVDQTLVAGPVQSVPADCAIFHGVICNVSGTNPAGAVTVTDGQMLDLVEPGWRSGTAGATVHFIYDERNPSRYEVYPPAAANAKVRVAYSKTPADIASGTTLSSQEELMRDALVDYTVARALLDDAESPVNQQRAVMHMQAFASMTGANLRMLLASSPNARSAQ